MKSKRLPSVCGCGLLTLGLAGLLPYPGIAADLRQQDPANEGDCKYQIGPYYTDDAGLKDRGNPKGKSFEFSMALSDSKIFRGDDSTLTAHGAL